MLKKVTEEEKRKYRQSLNRVWFEVPFKIGEMKLQIEPWKVLCTNHSIDLFLILSQSHQIQVFDSH